METEDFIKTGNIQKYGFFFWIMLSGVAILALAISHGFAPRYGALGIIFFTGGVVGYCFSETADRYSAHKLNAQPSFRFHIFLFIISIYLNSCLGLCVRVGIHRTSSPG
jgi:hypothetical protein